MKKSKIVFNLLLVVLLVTMAIGCNPSADKGKVIKVKVAHVISAADDSMWQVACNEFGKRLEELTDGRMVVEVFGGAVLGGELDYIDQMLAGTLEAAIVTNSPMGNHDANFHFYDLPYLFENLDEARACFVDPTPLEQWHMNRMEELGLKRLGFIEQGVRSFMNSKRPIHSLSDMKGLKLRVMESTAVIKTFEAFGASCTSQSIMPVS